MIEFHFFYPKTDESRDWSTQDKHTYDCIRLAFNRTLALHSAAILYLGSLAVLGAVIGCRLSLMSGPFGLVLPTSRHAERKASASLPSRSFCATRQIRSNSSQEAPEIAGECFSESLFKWSKRLIRPNSSLEPFIYVSNVNGIDIYKTLSDSTGRLPMRPPIVWLKSRVDSRASCQQSFRG